MVLSYNGWPASPYPSAIGINTGWEPIAGHKFPGGIKSGDVQTVMTYFVRQLDARVEPIEEYRAGDEWGWYYKQSANSPGTISNHSSGTAFDYNATQHPNGRRGTWTATQVARIREIQKEVNGVVYWLGDASGTPDEMHFEIRGSSAQVHTAALKIKAMGGNPPTPAPEEDSFMYRIYWFKSSTGQAAAYRVLSAKAEKSKAADKYVVVDAWWIKDMNEYKVWTDRGLRVMNDGAHPAPIRGSINYYNGPYDNTKTV